MDPSQNLSIWLTVPASSLSDWSTLSRVRTNVALDKRHSLDSAFARVESEDLLLPSDLSRIRRMVKDVYDGGVTDSDRRFLRTKFRRFKARGHENAFTEVFMDSVSQLVENYDKVIDIFT